MEPRSQNEPTQGILSNPSQEVWDKKVFRGAKAVVCYLEAAYLYGVLAMDDNPETSRAMSAQGCYSGRAATAIY